jgi:phosphoribosylformylglycinamidine synthase PurS subunit
MKARVVVTLKTGVLDPQGKAIEGALKSLGVAGVASVRQGKVFDIELTTEDGEAASVALREACEKLLANTIVEDYAIAHE